MSPDAVAGPQHLTVYILFYKLKGKTPGKNQNRKVVYNNTLLYGLFLCAVFGECK
jgi:hypothetical protein